MTNQDAGDRFGWPVARSVDHGVLAMRARSCAGLRHLQAGGVQQEGALARPGRTFEAFVRFTQLCKLLAGIAPN